MPWVLDKTGASNHSGGTAATVMVSTGAPNELLILAIFVERNTSGTISVSSVTGGGLTWTKRTAFALPVDWASTEIWYAFSPSTLAATSITINTSVTMDDMSIAWGSFSGGVSAAFDPNASLPAQSNFTTGTASQTISTTDAPDLGLAVMGSESQNASATPPTGWSLVNNSHNGGGTYSSNVGLYYTNYISSQSGTTVSYALSVTAPLTWIVDAASVGGAVAAGQTFLGCGPI